MRAHPHSADLQTAACRALTNLCTGSVSSQKNVRSTEGGIEAIQDALRVFSDNGVVSGAACSALRALNADVDMQ